MATTNYEIARDLQEQWPHTFLALQKFFVAIDDFSRDRSAPVGALNDPLFAVLAALEEDGFVQEGDAPAAYLQRLEFTVTKFVVAFPNWQDCYALIRSFFESGKAEAHIRELLYGGREPGDE